MGQEIAVKCILINDNWKGFIKQIEEMKMADNRRVAKKAKDEKRNIENRKPTEIEILRGLTHQNIIRIYNFCVHDRFIYIPIEICDMNLEEYLNDFDYEIKKRLEILKQIGCGLKYLHCLSSEIIHRDLQPRNVLIKIDNTNLSVKLSDFGISRVLTKDDDRKQYLTEPKGSLYSKPPEVILQTGVITMAVDIYAYGCLMQTLITKDKEKIHPFGNMNNADTFKKDVVEGNRKNFLATENERTDFLILADLAVCDAINKEYEKRPDIRTVTKHPLFWTTRKKELLLKGINNDYFRICSGKQTQKCANSKAENADEDELLDGEKQKATGFIDDFNAKFTERFEKRQDNSIHWGDVSELRFILGNKSQRNKPDYDTKYSTLINKIRNICEHYLEYKEDFKNKTDVNKMLGTNTTDFIRHILSKYPYLIHDICTCYRKALLRGECDCNYHDYFEYFVNSKSFNVLKASLDGNDDTIDALIQNSGYVGGIPTSSHSVDDKIIKAGNPRSHSNPLQLQCEGFELQPYVHSGPAIDDRFGNNLGLHNTRDPLPSDYGIEFFRERKAYITLEHWMRFGDTSLRGEDFKHIFGDSVFKMDYDYVQSLECEIGNLDGAGIPIKLTRSCKYGVIENGLFTEAPIRFEVIQTSKCLNHETHDDDLKQITFDLQQVRKSAGPDYHWWLEYTENSGKRRMFSFVVDDTKDFYEILKCGKDIMLCRSSEKFKEDILSKLYG